MPTLVRALLSARKSSCHTRAKLRGTSASIEKSSRKEPSWKAHDQTVIIKICIYMNVFKEGIVVEAS